MKRIALTVVLLVSLAAPAWAGFDEGFAAYERGDYETALREWEPLAEQGHAEAQFNIGLMYDKGQGMPQDDAKAAKWYRRAAEQGDADAQNNLGAMYEVGQGVLRSYVEALKWYYRAAQQGDAYAQYRLGFMYYLGQGVSRDYLHYVEAYAWLSLAAARGENRARPLREIVAGKMTPEQIAEAEKLAREWKPKKE